MRLRLNPYLAFLSVLALGGALLMRRAENGPVMCNNRPLNPGESCRQAGGERTYDQMAQQVPQLSMWLFVVAVALLLLSLFVGSVVGRTNLPRSGRTWPSTRPVSIAAVAVVGLGFVPLGFLASSAPVTCGGRAMRPGDQCVSYRSGGSVGYSEVSGALVNQLWVYLLIASVLVIVAVVLALRRRQPRPDELDRYREAMEVARSRIAAQPESAARTARLAEFDRQLAHELGGVRPDAASLHAPQDGA